MSKAEGAPLDLQLPHEWKKAQGIAELATPGCHHTRMPH